MTKKTNTIRIKPTRAEIVAARDMQLRGECITVAQAYARASVADMLRGAQQIYDWMKGGAAPEHPVDALAQGQATG